MHRPLKTILILVLILFVLATDAAKNGRGSRNGAFVTKKTTPEPSSSSSTTPETSSSPSTTPETSSSSSSSKPSGSGNNLPSIPALPGQKAKCENPMKPGPPQLCENGNKDFKNNAGEIIGYCRKKQSCYDEQKFCRSQKILDWEFMFAVFNGTGKDGFCTTNKDCPFSTCTNGICCMRSFNLSDAKCPSGLSLEKALSFDKSCPRTKCEQGICMEVFEETAPNGLKWPETFRKQCCVYPLALKCPTGDIPLFPTDGTIIATISNCPENTGPITFPMDSKGNFYTACCPIIEHPELGKQPKDPFHQCTDKCGENEFCDLSIRKDGKDLNMKHCYEDEDKFCGSVEILGIQLNYTAFKGTGRNGFCKKDKECPSGTCKSGRCCQNFNLADAKCPGGLSLEKALSFDQSCPQSKCEKGICMEVFEESATNVLKWPENFRKQCCVYPPALKCPTGDIPLFPTDGTYRATFYNCPVNTEPITFPKDSKGNSYDACCPIIVHPKLGEQPKDPFNQCTDKCGKNEFCDFSIRKDGKDLSMKHCYNVPFCPTKVPVPVLDGAQLFTCDKGCNRDGGNPMFCHEGRMNVCCPLDCPFWKKSKNGISPNVCSTDDECTNSQCVNVPIIGKMCCPVDDDLMCPADQFPVLEKFEKPTECSTEATEYNGACCYDFVSKSLRKCDESAIHPVDSEVTCVSNTDCKKDEFCDDSVFLKDDVKVKGKPAHCYKLEKWGTVLPIKKDEKGIVLCESPSDDCESTRMRNCVPFSSAPTKLVCYTADCPFWRNKKEIEKSRIKDCGGDSVCDKGDHCAQVGFPKKQCCPVDPEAVCSTGLLPRLDSNDKPVESCHKKYDIEHKALDRKYCCERVMSKDYYSVGQTVEPFDYTVKCETNKDCSGDTFCGESMLKRSKKELSNKLKYCYKDPEGTGGILKEETKTGFTVCNAHSDCGTNKGEYCNKFLGYKKGICHLALCPLSKGLPKGAFTECQKDNQCEKDEYCHEVVKGNGIYGCCGIDDENFCPGGLIPQKLGDNNCPTEMFSYSIQGGKMTACCHVVISKTFKDAGSIWNLAERKELPEKLNSLLCISKPCDPGFFCDESVTMTGDSVRNNVKHCYPVPKSYGIVGDSVKACEKNDNCDIGNGELCDNNIKDLNKNFDGKAAICAKFKCPLTKSVFTAACSKDADCGESEKCHPLGTEKYKACCAADNEFLCAGGLIPSKVYGLLHHEGSSTLECEENYYLDGDGNSNGDKCCQKLISREIFANPYKDKESNKVEPVDQKKICKTNVDCDEDEFCGESMLSGSEDELKIKGTSVYHCYKTPNCAGIAVKNDNHGLKLCSSTANTCGENEVCDFDLASVNSGKYHLTGLCCKYDCKGPTEYIQEIKENTNGVAGRICSCPSATSEQEFCDESLRNDDNTIEVCENTGVYGTYRLCKYERQPFKCPPEMIAPLRNKNYEAFGCEHDIDCRKHSMSLVSSNEIPHRAVCSIPSQKTGELQKICCTADLCSDWNTERLKEDICQKDTDCGLNYGGKLFKGKCEHDPFAIDKTSHCCPYADQPEQDHSIDVINIYRTQKICSKLADCIGERRFCDPIEKKCMYNLRSHNLKKRKGSCSDQDISCGDIRTVCMIIPPVYSESQPQCYAHPFDECDSNAACGSEYYCAPPKGTEEKDYETQFRKCHKMPSNTIRDDKDIGLKQCKKNQDCGNDDLICSIDANSAVAVKPGYGYCKHKVQLKCRGKPIIKYKDGKLEGCSRNDDCDNSEYCDMDIKRPPSLKNDQGICCSRPSSCGGEIPEQTVGLKICGASGCDEENGETCITNISKEPGSNWKSEEGVCCKMSCPKFEHPEVVAMDFYPAGPLCTSDNCKNNTEAFRMCVHGENVTYSRCCSYKRKTDLCPSGSKGVVRDGLNAKTCSSNSDCPSSALCLSGWCCEQDFCPDGKTLRPEQKTCSEEKDCGQPSGAEATCTEGYCCPKMYNNLIQKPYVTEISCLTVNDCPHSRMFCHAEKGQCVHFGSRTELESNEKCSADNKTCSSQKETSGVCVFPNENRQDLPLCWMNPMAQKTAKPVEATTAAAEEESKAGMAVGIIAVVIIVIGAAGVGIFVYYKKSSAKRKKKKEAAAKAEKAAALKKKEDKGTPKKKEVRQKKEKPAEEAGGALKAAEQAETGTVGDTTTGGTTGGPMFITL